MGNFVGGIAGDIIGSVYEWHNADSRHGIEFFKNGCRYTDDTVLTCAVAEWLLVHKETTEIKPFPEEDSLARLNASLLKYGKAHPHAGYGHMFRDWLNLPEPKPMGSYGNGAGMRVSPVGFIAETEDECLKLAEMSAKVTHDHAEGIKGAQAIALAIYMARRGDSKPYIKAKIEEKFGYNLNHTIEDYVTFELGTDVVRSRTHKFDATCQTTVPEAIVAFLEGDSYEDVIENAIVIGGDSDTIACMAGAIAGAFYGVPQYVVERAMSNLPKDLFDVVVKFENKTSELIRKTDKYLEVNADRD